MNKGKLQSLLKTKMSRKDFLFFAFSAIITMAGITQLESALQNLLSQKRTKTITSKPLHRFSNGPYGGEKL